MRARGGRARRVLRLPVVVLAVIAPLLLAAALCGPEPSPSAALRAAQKITAEVPTLRAAGVKVQTIAVDAERHGVRVGIRPGSSPDSAAVLRHLIPGVAVSLHSIRVRPAVRVVDRPSASPWDAGMELYSTFYQGGRLYYRECTAGFNTVSPATGRTYVTTAGHCFSSGSTVMHSLGYSGQRVGVVTARSGYGTRADVELIPAAAGRLRNAVMIDGRQRAVTGYRSLTSAGTSVCKYGIATGQTCGNVVRDSSVTVCYGSDGCIRGQEETYNSKLARVASYGDSGGPVYTYRANGTLAASGIVSGFGQSCTSRGCYFNGIMYFTPIKNIRAALSVVP